MAQNRLNKVSSLEIKYGELHIKQYHTVTYLGCLLDETLSGESMASKVIKTKLIGDSDFYIEKTGSCLWLFIDCFITLCIIKTLPLIKGGGGVGPSKNWVTWGGDTKNLLERGDNPERGGGVAVEIVGVTTFFIILQFNCSNCVWGEKVKFGLLHFESSVFWVNHARLLSKSL